MTMPAVYATNADGSKSIDKDAVKGYATSFVLTIAATAGLGALNALDLTTVPGWAAGAATYAVTTAIGVLTTYLSKKR
jgi:hypothetical protein